MIKQGSWINKFIQFDLIEKSVYFYKHPRNMKGARYKMLLICLGTNKKLFISEIMKLRINILPKWKKINKRFFVG